MIKVTVVDRTNHKTYTWTWEAASRPTLLSVIEKTGIRMIQYQYQPYYEDMDTPLVDGMGLTVSSWSQTTVRAYPKTIIQQYNHVVAYVKTMLANDSISGKETLGYIMLRDDMEGRVYKNIRNDLPEAYRDLLIAPLPRPQDETADE